MDKAKRKQNPRAPGIALDEAIGRVVKIYKEEGRHSGPAEVVVKHLGYSGLNGAASAMIASLRYWGLLDRPKEGHLMVTKDFEDYQFTPDEAHKRDLLIRFLKCPSLFADLLEKYQERLPSDANVKFDLIQRGFNPATADACLAVFKRSVDFARYFESPPAAKASPENDEEDFDAENETGKSQEQAAASGRENNNRASPEMKSLNGSETDGERIPVKLGGGRRAWLEIPNPFYAADKQRLKAYIDLHLADDEDDPAKEKEE